MNTYGRCYQLFKDIFLYLEFYPYLPTPPLEQDTTQGQFLSEI